MAFSLKNFIFGGKTFCCCLPVRLGVLAMTFISIWLTGILSVAIWFKTSRGHDLTSKERTALILIGIVETPLFIASVLGFSGAVVRKLLFVVIYAYFVYGHFIINIIVAIYILWIVAHASRGDIVKGCEDAITDPQAKAQCKGLFQVTIGVFFGVAALVLIIELYGAIIVTRYVNQLRSEKATHRESRYLTRRGPFRLLQFRRNEGGDYNELSDYNSYPNDPGFNPYEHYPVDPYTPAAASTDIDENGKHHDGSQTLGRSEGAHGVESDTSKLVVSNDPPV